MSLSAFILPTIQYDVSSPPNVFFLNNKWLEHLRSFSQGTAGAGAVYCLLSELQMNKEFHFVDDNKLLQMWVLVEIHKLTYDVFFSALEHLIKWVY